MTLPTRKGNAPQQSASPYIHPCASCGVTPETIQTDKPEGRLRELYRIACVCGRAAPQWSVSDLAAVRLWNRIMSNGSERE